MTKAFLCDVCRRVVVGEPGDIISPVDCPDKPGARLKITLIDVDLCNACLVSSLEKAVEELKEREEKKAKENCSV